MKKPLGPAKKIFRLEDPAQQRSAFCQQEQHSFPQGFQVQGAAVAGVFASGKGGNPFSVSEISGGLAPAGWRLQRDRWDDGILEQQHGGSPQLCDTQKEQGGRI